MADPNKCFSISCAECGDMLKTQDQHSSVFEFIPYAQAQGWIVPQLTDNKPIVCPKCHKKP